MKRSFLLFILFMMFFVSCSTGDEDTTELSEGKDWVEVKFNIEGDFFNVEEKPLTKVDDKQYPVYYHIRAFETGDPSASPWPTLGYVGLFSDLKYARLKLKRNQLYELRASALVDLNSVINIEDINKVYVQYEGVPLETVNIYNQFSNYYNKEVLNNPFSGCVDSPSYEDQNVDFYYKISDIKVTSNEVVNITPDRYSYMISVELDSPIEGHVVLSCDSPKFAYKIDTNDKHFSHSVLYSYGRENIDKSNKPIVVKLEQFDAEGISTNVATREIQVKPQVESIINVSFDKYGAQNIFEFTLKSEPMKKEHINW